MPPSPAIEPAPSIGPAPSGRSRRDLFAIMADGMAFSVMVGVGEAYIPAFALAIGLGEVTAGWVVSIPLMAGAVLQLVSPVAVARLRSYRRWVVMCAITQALSMLGFLLIALTGIRSAALIYLVATVYWGAGLATGPAWNAWVGTLVPRRVRARFFAQRTRLAHGAVFAGLVAAGLALQAGETDGHVMRVFASLFAIALGARSISAALLASQREPRPPVGRAQIVTIRNLTSRWRGPDGRLLMYMLAVQAAVQVSGPFFTPYMLGELRFNYREYLMLLGTSFLAKMLVLPFVGSLVHRFGGRTMLRIGGLGIIPMSALWLISDSFEFLLAVQVISGSFWAVYELTTFLLLFEHIDESERIGVLTTYNLLHAIMTVTGALVGGVVLTGLGEAHTGYLAIFGISAALRLLTAPLLFRVGRIPTAHYEISVRALAVRPNSGSIDAPILTSLSSDGNGELGDRNH